MITKYPIGCDVNPTSVPEGMHWLTVKVKNIGDQELTNLDVKLNSVDTYAITVLGTGNHLPELLPNTEREVPFRVLANSRAELYVSVDGWKALRLFHWESGAIRITVDSEVAAIQNLSAMTERHPPTGQSIRCEAVLEGFAESEGLSLELSAGTPDGEHREIAKIEINTLEPEETAVYSAEFTPHREGLYTLYAYLYKDAKRIDRQVEHVYVIPA
jgi:hypothetical protein